MSSPNKQVNIYPDDELLEWIDSSGESRNHTICTLLKHCRTLHLQLPRITEARIAELEERVNNLEKKK